MRMVFPNIETIFEISEGYINTLVIENPKFYLSILQDIYEQSDGREGKIILSEADCPIKMFNNVEVISSFIPFDMNKKSLVNKIIANLEKEAMSEENYLLSSDILSQIEEYLLKISEHLYGDIEFEKINIPSLIKSAGVNIKNDSDVLVDKLYDYIELIREYDGDKLFVLVNMRSYFSTDEREKLYQSLIDHDVKVFLIDSISSGCTQFEKQVVIDADLCEI